MRILQLIYNLAPGGAERFVVDLSNELCKTNDVIVLCFSNKDNNGDYYASELNSSIKLYFCNLPYLTRKGYIRLYKIIKKFDPDIVHAHSWLKPIILPAFFYWKPKYFHTIHSLAPYYLEKESLKPLYKFIYKHFVRAVTISLECRQSFIELYKMERVIRIDNGRSKPLLTFESDDVKSQIKRLKKNNETKIFVHIARCHELKNQTLLCESFRILETKDVNAVLMIIGPGFESSTLYEKYFDCNNIFFLGLKSNIADYLDNSDYFILTSIWEGLPLSLLEAMSWGCIPVCTAVGGIKDVIVDGENGYLCRSFDSASLVNTIMRAIENKEEIQRSNITKCYESSYSMQACAKSYLNLYLR